MVNPMNSRRIYLLITLRAEQDHRPFHTFLSIGD